MALLLLGAISAPSAASAPRVMPMRASLPKPGTPSQIAALVKVSSNIEQLPSPLLPALQNAGYDNASNYYPVIRQQCSGTTECVFGDKPSKTTVVLFGDSHAAMWLPPLVYDAGQLRFRIVLLWYSACPAASVTVWNPSQHAVNAGCTTWRAQSVSAIRALRPSLILLSDRTTAVDGPGGKPIANATWKAGMERTISDFAGSKLTVAVIGDITALTNEMPQCLAAHPSKIQDCSSPNPNPGFKTHVADEEAAARAKGVTYINPQSWLCTKKCSPVVGNMVVYYDNLHASATYAEYLSLLFEAAVKPLLPAG